MDVLDPDPFCRIPKYDFTRCCDLIVGYIYTWPIRSENPIFILLNESIMASVTTIQKTYKSKRHLELRVRRNILLLFRDITPWVAVACSWIAMRGCIRRSKRTTRQYIGRSCSASSSQQCRLWCEFPECTLRKHVTVRQTVDRCLLAFCWVLKTVLE